jgi:hypothetical protein
MARTKREYFFAGYEVITDDLRVGIVDHQLPNYDVVVRFHTPPWPFAEIAIKKPNQLKRVSVFAELEEALM